MVAVTWPLLGLYVAFQPEVMVCPDARLNFSDQPLMAALPVLVMVMLSVRPEFHALTALVTRQAPVPLCDEELEDCELDEELEEELDEELEDWELDEELLLASLTVMSELTVLW